MTSVPPPSAGSPAPHPTPPELPEVPAGVEPAPPRAAADGLPAWRWIHGFGALFSGFAAATVGGVIVFGIGGDFEDPPPAANIAATVLQDIFLVAAVLLFAGIVARPWPWQFGLRPPRSLKAAFGWVAASYLGFLLFTATWLTLIGETDTQDDLPDELGADESTAALLAVAFLVTVLAPLAEELLFRGFLFTALRNSAGPWWAMAITGAVFGLVHGGSSDPAFLLPLAVLGAALCLVYLKTGSLYPCIGLHCLNNSIAFGATQDWQAWQVLLLLAGALAVIAGIVALTLRLAGTPPAEAAPA